MRFLSPWAPNAPSMTLEAPKRVPIVQKGGIACSVVFDCVWDDVGESQVRRKVAEFSEVSGGLCSMNH